LPEDKKTVDVAPTADEKRGALRSIIDGSQQNAVLLDERIRYYKEQSGNYESRTFEIFRRYSVPTNNVPHGEAPDLRPR
jgi:hypothetical protein